ncbi:NYN domain-containing protein [bacterium]|nr:NYN domain-containing protein [candidate division CSSED10-310 bacterium]
MGRPGSGKKKPAINPVMQMDNIRLFIDAYNVIGTDAHLNRLKTQNLELARELLRKECGRYATLYPGHILYIVFDGDRTLSETPDQSAGRLLNERLAIREVFTNDGQTADEWILFMAAQVMPGNRIVIVTNDIDLMHEGMMQGMSRISVEVFMAECRKSGKKRNTGRSTSLGRGGRRDADPSRKNPGPGCSQQINEELKRTFFDSLDDPVTL